jgi:hypothetical protein
MKTIRAHVTPNPPSIRHPARASFLVFAIVIGIVTLSSGAEKNACSTRTTVGRYAVKCDGYLSLGANAPLLPAQGLAVATADRHGNFNGAGTVSVGGSPGLSQTVSGTEEINADCTGTITYHQTINGNPAPDINISFVVLREGSKILGIVTDPGAVYSCELTRVPR